MYQITCILSVYILLIFLTQLTECIHKNTKKMTITVYINVYTKNIIMSLISKSFRKVTLNLPNWQVWGNFFFVPDTLQTHCMHTANVLLLCWHYKLSIMMNQTKSLKYWQCTYSAVTVCMQCTYLYMYMYTTKISSCIYAVNVLYVCCKCAAHTP